MQITDVVSEEAELIGFVPNAVLHVLPIGEQIAPQRQDHCESVLGHRMHRVIADIGDGDAVFLAVRNIHDVVAGGRHRDHLEVRQLPQCIRAHRHLVDDGNGGARQARHDLADGSFFVLDVLGGEGRLADLGLERGTVQEHDPRRHAAMPAFLSVALFAALAGGLLRQ